MTERTCFLCGAGGARLYPAGPLCPACGPPPAPTPDPGRTLDGLRAAAGLPTPGLPVREAARPAVERPGAYRGSQPTSAAAAERVLPASGTQRRAVLDAILEAAAAGHLGATDPELVRRCQLLPNSERPRRRELVGAGLVRPSGRTRVEGGNAHIVWEPTPAALALLPRHGPPED